MIKRKHICIKTQLRNKQISIEITDHGLGIPKEDRNLFSMVSIE